MTAYSNTACINSNIIIQNKIPSISSITANKGNVSLNNGDTLDITLDFTEPVMITGTPVLNLSNGQTANMTSGTGVYTLSADFRYDIGSTENGTGLHITSISGGNIVDYSGNPLTRTIDVDNIKSNNIRIDNIAPTISLSENGNSTYVQSQSTTMYVTDTNGSGIGNVKYIWNTVPSTPSVSSFTQIGGNNIQASISGATGTRYLHIMATDIAGNVSNFNSSGFNIDNEAPTISINNNGGSFSKEHTARVNLIDAHSGINSNFKYLWSTSTTMPSDSEFDTGSSGLINADITKNTGDGNFYLYIRATDNAGNNAYFKSNLFVFDNTAPDHIDIVNNADSYSYQKNYDISISAEDTNGIYTDSSIKNIKYKWSDSTTHDTNLTTGWTIYSSGINYDNSGVTGIKYLHVAAEDIAGNIGYDTNLYTFDYKKPNINVVSSDLTGSHKSITSRVEVSDIHNDISVFKYIWREDIIENSVDGSWVTAPTTGKTGIGNPTKNDVSGNWYLHGYCQDNVGNSSYSITGPYTIDIDGPTGNITISESEINSGLITLNISATDNLPSNNLYYSLSQDNDITWSDWISFPSTVTLNNYLLENIEEGITKVSVKFKDGTDNVSGIYSDTVRIDVTPPTGSIVYSPEESQGWTKENVVASLTNLEDNLGGSVITPSGNTYSFTDNGSYIFQLQDELGNDATISALVTWIDKIDPIIAQITGNQTPSKEHQALISVTDNETSKDEINLYCQWSNSQAIPTINDVNWTEITNDSTIDKNNVDGEWYVHVKAVDQAGNSSIYTSGKYIFDNTPPVGLINITEEFINHNSITINLECSDVYSNESNISYSISEDNINWEPWTSFVSIINGYETTVTEGEHTVYVKFKDGLGNESNVVSDKFIIDKTPPSGNISYSSDDSNGYISADVRATLINITDNYSDSKDIIVNDTEYNFTENGGYTFTLTDATGNSTTISANVDWIDKTTPTITLTPNTNQTPKSSQSVGIHVEDNTTVDEEITICYQWTQNNTLPVSNDVNWLDITNDSTVSIDVLDGEYYLHIKAIDKPGNIKYHTSGKFVLDNEGPTGSINIVQAITNTNTIDIGLSATDNVSQSGTLKYALSSDGFTWSEYKLMTSQVSNYEIANVEGTTEVYVKYMDELSNESDIYSDTVELDLTPPSADIYYSAIEEDGYINRDVVATLTNISDNYSILENINMNAEEYVFETNGSYEFSLTDEVGNVKLITAKVNFIDKESPIIQSVSGNLNSEKSHSGLINVTDNITESNNLSIQYQWNQSLDILADDNSEWIDVANDTSVSKEGIDGDWYLHIKAIDGAGNTAKYVSGKYVFDNTSPVGYITYSTESRTAQPVTATLTSNETITVVNPNDGNTKYVFNENGQIQFEFMDHAGNQGTTIAKVDWIDKNLPSANVSASTTSWSKDDIILTISVPSDSRISIGEFDFGTISQYELINETSRELISETATSQCVDYKEIRIGENGTILFNILDVDTLLSQEIEVSIDNIDKVNPEYEVSLSELVPTMNDVVININTSDNSNTPVEIVAPDNAIGSNGQYTVSSNGNYNFSIKDMAGNEVIIPINITNIDRTAPDLQITYSESEWTNQDVTATVISNEEIIVTNNNSDTNYVFTDNGEFVFQVKDLAGNEKSITATVSNIDKIIPEAVITYSPVDITNRDVIVSIVPDEEVIINSSENLMVVENETNKYMVKQNGTYNFILIDRAGNEKIKSIRIENIDKDPAQITYTLSTESMTNQDVQIFLQGNESFDVITVPETIKIIETETETKYYAEESGNYTFEISDRAGNITNKIISITNIDKVAPVLSIAYSNTEWTNGNVLATVSADEEITILNNDGSDNKTFNQNGEFEFQVKDLAGNVSKVTAQVNNIDKQNPNASITFTPNTIVNTDVIIKIIPDEIVSIESTENLSLVNGSINEFVVVNNGDYHFTLMDQAGNETIKEIMINNIDKESPIITYSLSTDDKTNQEVEIYLNGNEAFSVTKVPEGIRAVTINDIVKYYAKISGEYIFEVVDSYGNVGESNIVVTNIDVVPPTLSITYSADTWTNQNVIATIAVDEEIVVLNNNNSPEYEFLQNGEFTFYVEDTAGNQASIIAEVDIIDKKQPSATFEYSTIEITKEDIQVIIKGNELLSNITSIENLELIDSSGTEGIVSSEYNITSNGEYHFTITDLAGNSTEYEIYIVNIDKVPPVMEYTLIYDTPVGLKEVNQDGVIIKGPIINTGDDSLIYQDSLITKNDILLKFNANETFTIIEKPQEVTIDKEDYYVISNNGTFNFKSQDIAGNITDINIIISTIAKSTPQVNIVYSETGVTKNDVIATVESTNGEYIRVVNNYNNYSRVFTDNGEYTFIVQDYAGNEIHATATVSNIDRSLPILTLTYDKTSYTNQSVNVEVSANEEFIMLNNEGNTTYTFKNNGEVKFIARDLIGNINEIIAKVDYIDKTPPKIIFTGQEIVNIVVGENRDLLADVTTMNYEDSRLEINYTSNLDINKPGSYTITYEVTDHAGNKGIRERQIIVIDNQLTATFNGKLMNELDYLTGNSLEINIYNPLGEYKILYSKGKITKGQMKIRGTEFNDEVFEISESGWYSFMIYDQERNTRFYNLLIQRIS
ncbi:hypothetical protein AN1V17_06500 [Vallitalea sediminicola]